MYECEDCGTVREGYPIHCEACGSKNITVTKLKDWLYTITQTKLEERNDYRPQ